MKKISLIIASTVLVGALAACGNEKEEPKEENQNKVEQKSEDKVEGQSQEEKEDVSQESKAVELTFPEKATNEFGDVKEFINVFELKYTLSDVTVEDLNKEKEFEGERKLEASEIENLKNLLLTAYGDGPDGNVVELDQKGFEENEKIASHKIVVTFSDGEKRSYYQITNAEHNTSNLVEIETKKSAVVDGYYNSKFSDALLNEDARQKYLKEDQNQDKE